MGAGHSADTGQTQRRNLKLPVVTQGIVTDAIGDCSGAPDVVYIHNMVISQLKCLVQYHIINAVVARQPGEFSH